jgi:hypothetical protein
MFPAGGNSNYLKIREWEQREQRDRKLTYQMDNKAPDSHTNLDSSQKTKYFGSKGKRHYFKQNTESGGTEVECWTEGTHFRHLVGSIELGTAAALADWKLRHGMVAVDEREYLIHFNQVRHAVIDKYEKKLQERKRLLEKRQNKLDNT